jgi:hypothetical protein
LSFDELFYIKKINSSIANALMYWKRQTNQIMRILKFKTKILIKQKNDSLNFLIFEGIFKKKINENFNFLLKKLLLNLYNHVGPIKIQL